MKKLITLAVILLTAGIVYAAPMNLDRMMNVIISTPAGVAIGTPTGESGDTALAVHIEHLHQHIWNHYFKLNTAVTDTLNGAVSADSKILVLNDATGFSANDMIDISLGAKHVHMYRKIISIATNTLTLDSGLDVALTDGSVITQTSFNMAVNGSVTPQVFTVRSTTDEKVDIMRLLLSIVDNVAADDGKFGGIAALTNGVHIRRNMNDGTYQTLAIWRANKDMKEDMYDVAYTDKAGGGNYGVNGRWTIFETGAVLNIDGDLGETIECVIQDDLTTLIDFQIKMQGHIEI